MAREHIRGQYVGDLGQFILQLWRDLSVQGQVQLIYMNQDDYRDELYPSELKDHRARAALGNFIDIDSVEEWARKSESFDLDRAEAVLTYQSEHFFEFFSDYVYDEEFSEHLLGYAIGRGLSIGDLKVVGQEAFGAYLHAIYDEHGFYTVELEIFGDVHWEGLRYGELSPDQQMHLVTNFLNSREGSDKDWASVVVPHLLHCMARHDQTADNVKAFLLQNLPT